MHSVEYNSILMFEYMILDLKCLLRAMVVHTYNVHSTPGIYWSIFEHHDRTSLLPAMRTNYYCLTRNRKARARKKKDKSKKQKAPGILPTTNPWREKEMSRKNKKKKPISSLLLSSSWLSFFGLRFPRDCLLMMTPMTRNTRQHTTAGPACPFLPFFDAHFPSVILGIHERSIDRPIEMDACMPACCPSFPLILQGFQSASLASQKQDQVKQNLARQSCFKSSCLCPHLLTTPHPPPLNDNLSFLRASPPGLKIWPYKNISHIHFKLFTLLQPQLG